MSAEPLLRAESVRKEFGGLVAVDDVDFTIPRGAIASLIGPNGAGKTTFFNMLTGVYKPSAGWVIFDGRGDRSDIPEHSPFPEHDRDRERARRHARASARGHPSEHLRHPGHQARGARGPRQ